MVQNKRFRPINHHLGDIEKFLKVAEKTPTNNKARELKASPCYYAVFQSNKTKIANYWFTWIKGISEEAKNKKDFEKKVYAQVLKSKELGVFCPNRFLSMIPKESKNLNS